MKNILKFGLLTRFVTLFLFIFSIHVFTPTVALADEVYSVSFYGVDGVKMYRKYGEAGFYSDIETNNKLQGISGVSQTKNYYDFNGWYSEQNCEGDMWVRKDGYISIASDSDKYANIANDVTLYPCWDPWEYEIYYEPNCPGDPNISGTDDTYTYNEKDLYETLGRDTFNCPGYAFKAWNTKEDGTGTAYGNDTIITDMPTSKYFALYAQWVKTTYNITLDDNGGTGGSGRVIEDYDNGWRDTDGNEINYVNIPTRTGHTFTGYYTKQDGGDLVIPSTGGLPGSETFTAHATLYAHWTPNTYYAIYVACGSGANQTGALPDQQSVQYGSSIKLEGNSSCSKPGYYFDGWRTGDISHTFNMEFNWNWDSNRTFFAHWIECPAGTYCPGNTTSATPCPSNSHSKAGATECTCNDGYSYNDDTTTTTEACVANAYTIILNMNGGSRNGAPEQIYAKPNDDWYGDEDLTQKIGSIGSVPEKNGYVFNGFFTNSNGTGTQVIASDGRIVAPNFLFDSDDEIYAYYTQCECTPGDGVSSCTVETTAGNECQYKVICNSGYSDNGNVTDNGGATTYTPFGKPGIAEYAATCKKIGVTTGYTCPVDSTRYISCFEGKYMATMDASGNYEYNGTPTLGNTCQNCPDDALCLGGTDAPLYAINLEAEGLPLEYSTLIATANGEYYTDLVQDEESGKFTVTPLGDTLPAEFIPAAPAGNTFNGYSDKNGVPYIDANGNFIKGPTEPITLYAQWVKTTYTITLDDNGGTGGSGRVIEDYDNGWRDTDGNEINYVNIPTRTGHTFTGYYTKQDGGDLVIPSTGGLPGSETFTAHATLYAHWTPMEYKIVYKPNCPSDPSIVSITETYVYNEEQPYKAAPKTLFNCPGYAFQTWRYQNRHATSPGSDVTMPTDVQEVEMTTQWVLCMAGKYSENGVCAPCPSNSSSGSGATECTCNDGYNYNGGTTTTTNACEPNQYTITFNANGGTGSMSTQTFTYGVAQNLTANAFTRVGHAFAGWNTTADGSGTAYADKESISNLLNNITLYAQWEQNQYIISYACGNGSGTAPSQITCDAGTECLLANSTCAAPAGYMFSGWKIDDTVYDNFTDISSKLSAGTYTVTAQYEEIEPEFTMVVKPTVIPKQVFKLSGVTGKFLFDCGNGESFAFDAALGVEPMLVCQYSDNDKEFMIKIASVGNPTLRTKAQTFITRTGSLSGTNNSMITKLGGSLGKLFGTGAGFERTFASATKLTEIEATLLDDHNGLYGSAEMFTKATSLTNISLNLLTPKNGCRVIARDASKMFSDSTKLSTVTDWDDNETSYLPASLYERLSICGTVDAYADAFSGTALADTCPAGTYEVGQVGGKPACAPCPSNSSSEAGATECTCNTGYHVNNQGTAAPSCSINTYTVYMYGNGGYIVDGGYGDVQTSMSRTYGDGVALPVGKFERTGYTFAGWNTAADGSGTSYADGTTENLTDENGATVNLYAQWSQCAAGEYEQDGVCVTCPKGSFCVNSIKSECDSGTYADKEGMSECTACPAGSNLYKGALYMVGGNYGSTSVDSCVAASYYMPEYTVEILGFTVDEAKEQYGYDPNADVNKRGMMYTTCYYDASTRQYTKNCMGHISICSGGYYTNVQMDPEMGTPTFETNTLSEMLDTYCVPVGTGYWSPGLPHTDFDNITEEEVALTYVRNTCPNGGTTSTTTSDSSDDCYKTNISCTVEHGSGKTTCHYAGTDYTNCAPCTVDTCNSGYSVNANKDACSENQYTITYNLDGGANAESNPDSYTVETATITLADASKTGYTFGGWYSDANFTTKVTQIAKGSTGNKTLYAKWTQCAAGTYEKNGTCAPCAAGTFSAAGATVCTSCPAGKTTKSTGQASCVACSNNANVDSWNNSGSWNSSTNATVTTCSIKACKNGYQNLSNACSVITYNIKYYDGSTELTNLTPTTYTVTSDTIILAAPTKTGYDFVGWYSDANFTTKVTQIAKGSTGNKTFWAKWTIMSDGCDAGEYLKAGETSCTTCPAGYACAGGTFSYDSTKDQGINACSGATQYQNQSGQATCKTVSDGYYKKDNTAQTECGKDYYCKNAVRTVCPDNGLTDTATASDVTACYKKNQSCTINGGVGISDKCTFNTTQNDYKNCTICIINGCNSGYYKDNNTCTICPKGSYCANSKINACPDNYTTAGTGATKQSDCFTTCDDMSVEYGTAHADNATVYAPAACTYSRGTSITGNPCDIKNGKCVETSCKFDYEMKGGKCTECVRDNAVSFKQGNGNCVVESCEFGYYPFGQSCVFATKECATLPMYAIAAQQTWDTKTNSYTVCQITECADGYHISNNTCISDEQTCNVANGIGVQTWNHSLNKWGECIATKCNPGYTNNPDLTNETYAQCGRCNNAFDINGDEAVSTYVQECEIQTCMYQGKKYIMENNECRLICDEIEDETGSRHWDSRNRECVHECNAGYLKW